MEQKLQAEKNRQINNSRTKWKKTGTINWPKYP